MKDRKKLKIITSLQVNSPCHQKNFKETSTETEKGWFCHECQKDVHDLSRYSKNEIKKLYQTNHGNFCTVIKRRADGSIITKDPISRTSSFIAAGVLLAATSAIADSSIPAIIQVGGTIELVDKQPNILERLKKGDNETPNKFENGEIILNNEQITRSKPSQTPAPIGTKAPMTLDDKNIQNDTFPKVKTKQNKI